MANSVDPDQTAPSGAVWSGSALFAYVILSETFRIFRTFTVVWIFIEILTVISKRQVLAQK